MSQPQSASTSSSNFQSIFNTALKAYEKKTKNDLLSHPLAAQLQTCNSPGDILAILKDTVKEFDRSRTADERLSRWLNPTVNVLLAFSATLGEGVGLVSPHPISLQTPTLSAPISQVFSPAKVIFAGIEVLLLVSVLLYLLGRFRHRSLSQAAKDVEASQDALVDLFERIENFFKRLETYTSVRPTGTMTDIIAKIMVEVLNIFAIGTKEMKQSRTSASSFATHDCRLINVQRSISRGSLDGRRWKML